LYNLAIHGSCVSRDFAEFENWNVVNYQARSSMCSKTGVPTQYDKNLLSGIGSNFQKRMVEWDLASRPFNSENADLILMDLIDERFDIFQHGMTVSTISQAYHDAKIVTSIPGISRRVERGSEEHFEFFTKGVERFSKDIDKPVILHNARWSTHYLVDNKLRKFEREEFHLKNNNLLDAFSEILLEYIPFLDVVSSPDLLISDPNHKWGLAPFHYISEYYVDIGKKIAESMVE